MRNVRNRIKQNTSELITLQNQQKSSELTALQIYDREINHKSILTSDKEKELAREKDKGSLQARNELVEKNLRLVRHLARSFSRSYDLTTEEYEELIQYGNEGLIIAANKFDDRGFRFSTFSSWWMRQTMRRALAKPGLLRNDKHIPFRLMILKGQIPFYSQEFKVSNGREPSRDELIDYICDGTTHKREIIESVVDVRLMTESLDKPLNPEESTFMIDLIENKECERPENETIRIEGEEKIERLDYYLSLLPARHEHAIRLRFLQLNNAVCRTYDLSEDEIFDMVKPLKEEKIVRRRKSRTKLTLEEVGGIMGLTGERVRTMEASALYELRTKMLFDPLFQSEVSDFQKEINLVFPNGQESVDKAKKEVVQEKFNQVFNQKPKRKSTKRKKPTLKLNYLEKELLDKYMGLLPKKKQQEVMKLVYGVNDGELRAKYNLLEEECLTYADIGKALGISYNDASQIKQRCEEMIKYMEMNEEIIPSKKRTLYHLRKDLVEKEKGLVESALSNIEDSVDRELVRLRYLEDTSNLDYPINGRELTAKEASQILNIPYSHAAFRETRAFGQLLESMKLIRDIERS